MLSYGIMNRKGTQLDKELKRGIGSYRAQGTCREPASNDDAESTDCPVRDCKRLNCCTIV